MKIYLVGGAVRDKLLGIPHQEKDYVVVGATTEEMLKKGFQQVGKDFPVFLHPQTKEEYALARRERKIGPGYTGFDFDASNQVTLEDDLLRRDLTINAMAETPEGELIDPYHGKMDLEKKILRHVSPAFSEDPVRILRVARFAARLSYLGFTIASETLALMKEMVKAGEVNALVAERVWKEMERALSEKNPEKFFAVLDACGASTILFPENNLALDALPRAIHPEIRFAVVFHRYPDLKNLIDRYRVPTSYRELVLLVQKYQENYLAAETLNAKELCDLLYRLDAFRRPERFEKFLQASDAITQHSRSRACLENALKNAKSVNIKEIVQSEVSGKDIAEKIKQAQITAIESQLGQW